MTMNLYLMGGSSIASNKLLMVFKVTDPEYSKESYLNPVTTKYFLIIVPKPIKTSHHQNSIHRRTASVQTTLYSYGYQSYRSKENLIENNLSKIFQNVRL